MITSQTAISVTQLARKFKIFAFAGMLCGIAFVTNGAMAQQMDPSNPLAQALNPSSAENETALPQGEPAPNRAPGMAINNGNANNQTAELTAEEKLQMIEDEEARREKRRREIRESAFDAALNGLLPLEPDEIKEVLKKYDRTREAIETPYYPRPTPKISVLPISLDPGISPPNLKLAVGHVTTLSILDATGEPWPVQDLSWAGDFQLSQVENGHILRITPLAEFAHGNLSMRLIGLKTPIIITLETQREVVQYRVDVRMQQDGPNAKTPLIQPGPGLQAGDGLLTAILAGAPPSDIEKLKVEGVDGRTTAYRANGMIYLRTPLTLLSPGWVGSARSGDGTNVYVMNDTPIVLMSDKGKMQRAQLKEDRDEGLL